MNADVPLAAWEAISVIAAHSGGVPISQSSTSDDIALKIYVQISFLHPLALRLRNDQRGCMVQPLPETYTILDINVLN